MKRSDLRRLQAIRSYPAVSILMPAHRTSAENQQDPIRLKNLITEATRRLEAELGKRDAAHIVEKLQALAGQYDHQRGLDGLALFATRDVAALHLLPFAPVERVVIDETFATRDLVFAMNRSPRYRALVLSEQSTRLFEGVREDLEEVTEGKFPLELGGPGGASKLPGGRGVNPSARRDASHRHFFQEVDAELGAITRDDELPLAVMGVDRYLAHYDDVTSHAGDIVAKIQGNYDDLPPHEIGRIAWPEVERGLAERRRDALRMLDRALGANRVASTIREVWRCAQDGRGRLLLVEEGYHQATRVDDTGRHIEPVDDPEAPGIIDDAVDEIIEAVLAQGGRVQFVDDGTLEAHSRIALILRY